MPYQVTFRAFTPEIEQVLIAFATSTNGTIVRTINVFPASGAAGSSNRARPNMAPQPTPIRTAGGAQEFLNEQLLRVTMEIVVVKLVPGA